jgi:DNA polymerase elongation subunit (family B)
LVAAARGVGVRILTLDLETSPNIAHVWGLWQQNVSLSQLMESTEVISWAGKWYGEKGVEFRSTFHDGKEAMVQRAHEVLDGADAVVHFNGTTFDMPHLRREFAQAGLLPPSPWKDIDLLKVVKRNFRFPSNKLQYVSTALGLKGKVQHSGHDLWVRCMAGDEKAWATMRRYNRGDVVLTEQLYERLLPWIHNHPSVALGHGVEGCNRCGSENLQKRGFDTTQLGKFQRLQCMDCGGWLRSGKRIDSVDARGVK